MSWSGKSAWRAFVDLMRDVADSAAELGEAERVALTQHFDAALADLRRVRTRVVAGTAGTRRPGERSGGHNPQRQRSERKAALAK